MRKFLSLLFASLAFVISANAQIAIDATEFTSNPARFNGRMVTIKNVRIETTQSVKPGVVPPAPTVGGPIVLGPAAATGPNPAVIHCNAPRSFKVVSIEFPDPQFKACFFMSEAMAKTLPVGQQVNTMVTFKGDNRIGYTITMFKVLP